MVMVMVVVVVVVDVGVVVVERERRIDVELINVYLFSYLADIFDEERSMRPLFTLSIFISPIFSSLHLLIYQSGL